VQFREDRLVILPHQRLTTMLRLMAKGFVRAVSSVMSRLCSVDWTDAFTARSTLIVAPHPDDETLGCGAGIARMRARGTEVRVVLVSGGGSSPKPYPMTDRQLIDLRRAEATRALTLLGVAEAHISCLDFPDGGLPDCRDAITDAIAHIIQVAAPEQVLVTSITDRHPDHRCVALAARRAVVDVGAAGTGPALFEYAIWQRVPAIAIARAAARSRSRGNIPAPIRVTTDGFLGAKTSAINAYRSQLPHFPPGFIDDFLLPFECFVEVDPAAAGEWDDHLSPTRHRG
jgi:LmbE family N-acetylglucosaminyl deacetylase